MSEKDFLIDDAALHFAASKKLEYRNRVRERFSAVIGFLQSENLTTRTLLSTGEQPSQSTKIKRSDLTEEGYAVVQSAYAKWLAGLDKGRSVADMSLFIEALRKVRSE